MEFFIVLAVAGVIVAFIGIFLLLATEDFRQQGIYCLLGGAGVAIVTALLIALKLSN